MGLWSQACWVLQGTSLLIPGLQSTLPGTLFSSDAAWRLLKGCPPSHRVPAMWHPTAVWTPLEGDPESWLVVWLAGLTVPGWTDSAWHGGGAGEMLLEEQKGRKNGRSELCGASWKLELLGTDQGMKGSQAAGAPPPHRLPNTLHRAL